MISKHQQLSQSTFDNPFDNSNANNLEAEKILEFWCTPFEKGIISDINEQEFKTKKMPIILEGSRGTGKTTILKYFSYDLQKLRAKSRKDQSVLMQILSDKSIGYYFRCDNSFLNTFKSVFKAQHPDNWLLFFTHFIELQFSAHLIKVVKELMNDSSKLDEYIIVNSIRNNCNINEIRECETLKDIHMYVDSQIKYIDIYKNELIFKKTEFKPTRILELHEFSGKIIESLNENLEDFTKVVFLLLIDEFEALTPEMQKLFNTVIKYAKPQATFRIGRRSEGNISTETINEDEYLRKNHDYFIVSINNNFYIKKQKDYFIEVAQKRLNQSNEKHGIINVLDMLGKRENLEDDCLALCKSKKLHLDAILSENKILAKDVELRNNVIKIIGCDSNPIAETLNALWVIRSKQLPLEAAYSANHAMNEYFNNIKTKESEKYKNDYTNKYKYSIACLLSSIYKQTKLYYSFNTIVYLSDSNTRTFINICNAIINDAMFYEQDSFLETKVISKESQNRAIKELALEEFDGICSIINYGDKIRNLVLNIGNILTMYHKDKKLKYPETNQFVYNKTHMQPDLKCIINIAESWSIIVKKEKPQRASLGANYKSDIYRLNRVFSPIFSISYRTRGGYNHQFKVEDINNMLKEKIDTKIDAQSKENDYLPFEQISLFE